MTNRFITLNQLFDLSLMELLEMEPILNLDPIHHLYSKGLVSYLQGDCAALSEVIFNVTQNKELTDQSKSLLYNVLQLRLSVRQRNPSEIQIQNVLEQIEQFPEWRGELLFIAAMAYEIQSDHFKSKAHYHQAWIALETLGAKKKAVTALNNHIASESRIHPEKRLVEDYFFVFKKARKVRAHGIAAVALMNISREYQLVKAHEISLKYCNRAIQMLTNDFGSLHYYLVLMQRCHVLLDLGRKQEALLDYQSAKTARFPEVIEGLKVLSMLFEQVSQPTSISDYLLTSTWKERLSSEKNSKNKKQKTAPLGALENQFINLISGEPKTKFEITEYLYGTKTSFLVTENRFKSLLNRLRKKRPGLIVFKNGKYTISDNIFLTENEKLAYGPRPGPWTV